MKGTPGKAPAFQFYVKDWLSDSQLQMADVSVRGIWINILCYMWDAPSRGTLETTTNEIARIAGCTVTDAEAFIAAAKRLKFCDVFVTDTGTITLVSRRMAKEESVRKSNRLRKRKQRGSQGSHADVTPPSPIPTPTTLQKHTSKRFDDWWSVYPKKSDKKKALVKWKARCLDEKADMLIADVLNRIKNDRKWRGGYIPMPTTYINGDRWDDEVEKESGVGKTEQCCENCTGSFGDCPWRTGTNKPPAGKSCFNQIEGRK